MKLLLLLFVFSNLCVAKVNTPIALTSVNVSATEKQGDAHLIDIPGSAPILIDTGSSGKGLAPYLISRKVHHIRDILISHVHEDHYGALVDLLKEPIQIDRVWMNIPPKNICDSEKPWGCNWDDVHKIKTLLEAHKIKVNPVTPGQIIFKERLRNTIDIELKVLYIYDDVAKKSPIKDTDVNDTSSILKLTVGKTRVLFTGDLNARLGTYLAEHAKNLEADIIKVPHHGAEGVAPNIFFDRVSAKAAIIPSPQSLWVSDRSKRLHDYFTKKLPPECVLVNGRDGHLVTEFFGDHAEMWPIGTKTYNPNDEKATIAPSLKKCFIR